MNIPHYSLRESTDTCPLLPGEVVQVYGTADAVSQPNIGPCAAFTCPVSGDSIAVPMHGRTWAEIPRYRINSDPAIIVRVGNQYLICAITLDPSLIPSADYQLYLTADRSRSTIARYLKVSETEKRGSWGDPVGSWSK